MRFVSYLCRIVGMASLFFSVAVAAPPTSTSAQPSTPGNTFRINERGINLQFPQGWSVEHRANMYRLIRTTPDQLPTLTNKARAGLATITTSSENRKDHAEALLRLQQIAAESNTPSTFLTIGGWPALQRSELIAKPQMGQEDKPFEAPGTLVHVTTAIAAGATIFRMDGFVDQKADPAIAQEMLSIGLGTNFTNAGNAKESSSEVQGLKQAPPLRTIIPAPNPKSSPKVSPQLSPGAQPPASGFASSNTTNTGLAFNLQIGTEPEVIVSTDGTKVVVAQQCKFSSSNDGGVTFPFGGGTPHCGGGDSSLGFGKSGNFYEATIGPDPACSVNAGICATAINLSTDGGQTFSFLTNSVTCATSSCGFGGIPDQEHIAADRFIQTATGDQVYAVFRLGTGYDLSCSTNSGSSFGNETQVNNGSSDFPRITVGQDGFVYVVTTNGGNIEVDKYSSCASGLVEQFHSVVASGVSQVTCPVAGLDRCNNGNDLRSPSVAVDDTNGNHVYVTYAINTISGTNENVIVQDSLDGGNTWGGSGRVTQINNSIPTRRFMPWVCSVGGTAYVSWYDRRNAAPSTDDLTDYFAASASLDDSGNLASGTEFQVNTPGTSDPECAGGATPGSAQSWPCGARATGDASTCSFQPQLAGRCWTSGSTCGSPGGVGSGQACDLNNPSCSNPAETCTGGSGVPKYGDYNGNACAAGRFYTVYGSGTSQPNATAASGINLFFTSTLVCCEPQIQIPGPVSLQACRGSSNTATANVCNTGKGDLMVNAITSSSSQVSVTTPTSGFPVIVSPDACFPFQVQFSPTGSSGTVNATLTVSSNDTVNPSASFQVNGTADAPSINATIVSGGNFGDVCSGSSNNVTLAVTNQSNSCNLVISNITSNNTNFLTPSVHLPLTLSPDATVPLPITFQPTGSTCSNTVSRSGQIAVFSNDPTNPALLENVSGIVPCPSLVLSPQNLTGAFAYPATVSDPTGTLGCFTDRQISVSNAGACPLNITGLVAAPSDTYNVINPTVPLTVAPGAAPVPITVRFRPTNLTGQLANAPDQKLGTLTITSNDPVGSDNSAGLCGEPTVHSGARVLVIDSTNNPVVGLQSLTLASKGLTPGLSEKLSDVNPLTANVCGNTITYHLDNETLAPAGTTGNNPLAEYTLDAKNKSTHADMSFTLGQCQLQQIILQVK